MDTASIQTCAFIENCFKLIVNLFDCEVFSLEFMAAQNGIDFLDIFIAPRLVWQAGLDPVKFLINLFAFLLF